MRAVARLIVAARAVFAHVAGGAVLCRASDAVEHVWVQVAPPHVGIVRALTQAPTCPEVRFDRRAVRMSERAAPDNDFDSRVCERRCPRAPAGSMWRASASARRRSVRNGLRSSAIPAAA